MNRPYNPIYTKIINLIIHFDGLIQTFNNFFKCLLLSELKKKTIHFFDEGKAS